MRTAGKTHKTPDELREAMIELFGGVYGNGFKLAAAMGKHEVTISRWVNGRTPVDKTSAKLLDAILERKRNGPVRRKPAASHAKIQDML